MSEEAVSEEPVSEDVDAAMDDSRRTSDADVDHDAVAPSGGRAARITAIVVGVFVAGLVGLFALGDPSDGTGSANSLVGARVPVIDEVAIDGRPFDIDDRRGQWVVVNFFATWCPPCIAEHPDLVELERWGRENGRLEMLSVAFNDSPEGVQQFFDDNGGDWPVLDDAALSIKFQIAQVPESFLIAPSGIVFRHYVGGVTAQDIINDVEANDQ